MELIYFGLVWFVIAGHIYDPASCAYPESPVWKKNSHQGTFVLRAYFVLLSRVCSQLLSEAECSPDILWQPLIHSCLKFVASFHWFTYLLLRIIVYEIYQNCNSELVSDFGPSAFPPSSAPGLACFPCLVVTPADLSDLAGVWLFSPGFGELLAWWRGCCLHGSEALSARRQEQRRRDSPQSC